MRQRSRQTERLGAPWLKAKCVDASPSCAKGGYSPMNGGSLPRKLFAGRASIDRRHGLTVRHALGPTVQSAGET
jgi:hypothetical protein